MEGLGSLALLGSVGFGLAFSNLNDPNWSYEYKVGNDGNYVGGSATATADLALLEESPVSVMEKVSVDRGGFPRSWIILMSENDLLLTCRDVSY